jgi:hypothetical protein
MIREGELIFLHFYDIGGEVKLKEIEKRLQQYGKVRLEQISGSSWIEQGVRITVKDDYAAEVLGKKSPTDVKIFSIGGILVRITVSVREKNLSEVLEIISNAEEKVNVKQNLAIAMADFAKDLANRIKEDIGPLITNQYTNADYEERYRVILVKEGDRDRIEESRKEIAGLIRKELPERISSEEVEEIVGNRYSHRDNFFIADIRGTFAFVKNIEAFPVLRAVEFCILQKLELRIYDSLLDQILEKSYDILEKAESKANRELAEKINDIHLMRLELLEIVSAMKGIRGSPKAMIFSSLVETLDEVLDIDDLADSVTRKLDRLGEIYTMVYESLQNTRFIRMDRTMLVLEGIIVILIVIEIGLILLGRL